MTYRQARNARCVLYALSVLALAAAACGGGNRGSTVTVSATLSITQAAESVEETDAATAETENFGLAPVDPLSAAGNIAVAGSSTVFPLAERIASRFQDEGYPGLITVDSIGSGAGFERFCVAGESDISNASRPINAAETESCESIGRKPIELRVGTDALAVAVSPGNTFASDLTSEELKTLFSTADTWADVRDGFPANPVQRFIPGTDSGTFDYFVEAIFDKDKRPILASGNTQMSEDDNVLVRGITGDGCDPSDASTTCAVGFFGYAYYAENSTRLSVLRIEGVEPTMESVNANAYLLSRPLFMYSTASIIAEKPQVGVFLSFVLQFVNEEITEVGYFPALDPVLQSAADKLKSAFAAG